MRPTEMLEKEHRVIEQVLACLERMASDARKGKAVDRKAGDEMVDFFRNFADRFHHAKEEQHLFPALEAHGMPRDGGPTGVMLTEHEMGRDLVNRMDRSLRSIESGDRAVAKEFADAATGYIHLLREHIQKEDHCLFSMTNSALDDAAQADLLKAFRLAESAIGADRGYDFYNKKARELAARFHLEKRESGRQPSDSSCCHHGAGACSGS